MPVSNSYEIILSRLGNCDPWSDGWAEFAKFAGTLQRVYKSFVVAQRGMRLPAWWLSQHRTRRLSEAHRDVCRPQGKR